MLALDKDKVIALGETIGWHVHSDQENPPVVILRKGEMQVNVYYTTATVATTLPHPVKGRNQLFRYDIDMKLLRSIFQNPRVHTTRGYRFKHL